MTNRKAHLAWCKQRALEYVEAGDLNAAVTSMLSDIGKFDGPPLYNQGVLNVLTMDGMFHRKTADEVRSWIEGFN